MEEDIKFLIRDLKAMSYNLHFVGQIENLLKRYKELEEENKLLTEKADTYYELYWEKCIPISVIQNKIDEMNKIINSSENRNHIHTKIEASIVKGELQDLLKEK